MYLCVAEKQPSLLLLPLILDVDFFAFLVQSTQVVLNFKLGGRGVCLLSLSYILELGVSQVLKSCVLFLENVPLARNAQLLVLSSNRPKFRCFLLQRADLQMTLLTS